MDVVIPQTIGSYTIRSIGKNAFSSSNISSIVLPNSVERIEDEAFKQCENLESIMLPEGLISIGDEAFYECRKLATLKLPSTLLTIGSKAFMSCELITTLILPDSLTAFYSFAFSGLAIQSVKIPEQITSIPSFAFSNCKNLKEVSLPIGISNLGWKIFSNTSLEILEWPVHTVPDNASLYILDGCESIRELYIPTGSSSRMIYDSIGSNIFIERIILEDSKSDGYLDVLKYGEMILNTYHTPLREFSYSVSEQEVTITDFSGNDLYVGIPEEIEGMPVTKIGAGAFRDCTQIKGIQIVSSIKSIDADAFMNCTNLEHIEFQDGIQEIGPRAFANCISLEYIQLPNSLRKLSELVFINASSLKRIVLPDGLQTIGAGNFQGCSSLQGIMIPRSVKDIGPYQFLDCSQLNYIASPLSGSGGLWATKWDAGFDGLYMWNHIADTTAFSHTPIDDATTILTGYDMGEEQSIQIPMFMEGYLVSRIGEKAFFEQPLTHITIPPSVTHIDGAAFLNSGVHDIEFPDSLQEIGNDSFRGCSSLESIQWPNNLEMIGARAFKDCVSLDLEVLPQSLCTIYDEAFGGCDSIDQISIPTNILLKYAIFQNCEGLTDVYFEMQEKPYNNYWLAGPNTELHFLQTTSELSFVGSVWEESPYVITEKFIGPENHVVLPNMLSGKPLTGINSRTFHAVANVKSVRITDGIESIGMHAFTLCPQLTEVYIADTVEKIGPQAFKDCPNLKTVFCEVSSKPEGWDDQWLGNTNPIIVWGYSGRW
ncbi:leucine-rich repeat protein [uncultured Sphaerochaeta sp.]|uniref:leucine-rich repeat domain-containing protein n=1 Tax=uncultured Sphaerochaeta sp. TaxID=886478 RepID=UPI0029C9F003|nr:leucine-rich repeat protein [uncultured Sphaerochaeta sp.]